MIGLLPFNCNDYEKTNGVAVKIPIAPLLTEIRMNVVAHKITKSRIQRQVFFRYVVIVKQYL